MIQERYMYNNNKDMLVVQDWKCDTERARRVWDRNMYVKFEISSVVHIFDEWGLVIMDIDDKWGEWAIRKRDG